MKSTNEGSQLVVKIEFEYTKITLLPKKVLTKTSECNKMFIPNTAQSMGLQVTSTILSKAQHNGTLVCFALSSSGINDKVVGQLFSIQPSSQS